MGAIQFLVFHFQLAIRFPEALGIILQPNEH